MSFKETEEGLEILDIRETRGDMNTSKSDKAQLQINPTSSMTDSSFFSIESQSCELEYSDEDLSIISTEDHRKNEEESKRKDDCNEDFGLEFPSIRTLDLVIDEIPAIQSKSLLTKTKATGLVSPLHYNRPISTNQTEKFMACPCCRSYVNCVHRKKDRRFSIPSSPSSMDENSPTRNALTSFVDGLWPNQQGVKYEIPSGDTASSNIKSMGYTIKQCLIEGWLNKKGTGNDMFRSTFWKPRWCSLVMATIPSYEQDVPLLLVSWHTTVKPTNIIILESSIAIIVNQNENTPGSEHDNIHCFDIVSRDDDDNNQLDSIESCHSALSNGKLTKTFSAELEQRDEWVSKINEAVGMYEKSKISSIRQSEERLLPPTSPVRGKSGRKLRNVGLNGLSIAC